MSTTFDVRLTESEWDQDRTGWRCPVLRIPGAKVNAFYSNGKVDDSHYKVEAAEELIRWSDGSPPTQATLTIVLTEELSSKAATTFWQRLAIVIPVITTVVGALLTSTLQASKAAPSPTAVAAASRPAPSPGMPALPFYETWQVAGSVSIAPGQFGSGQIVATLRPPHLSLLPDGSFGDEIPVKNDGNGVRTFPTITFVSGNSRNDQPVIHLGSNDDPRFRQDIDDKKKTITIKTPVTFQKLPVYRPNDAEREQAAALKRSP